MPVREPSPLDEELSLWDALQGLGRGYTRVHVRPRPPHHEGGWGFCPLPVQDPLDFALQWGTLWTEEGPQVQGLASGPHPKAPSNRLSAPLVRQHHSDSKTPPCPQEPAHAVSADEPICVCTHTHAHTYTHTYNGSPDRCTWGDRGLAQPTGWGIQHWGRAGDISEHGHLQTAIVTGGMLSSPC